MTEIDQIIQDIQANWSKDDKCTMVALSLALEVKKLREDLRDRFAMAALPETMRIMDDFAKKCLTIIEPSSVARTAYDYADAMLEQRSKEKP